jgi:hypothetical protein
MIFDCQLWGQRGTILEHPHSHIVKACFACRIVKTCHLVQKMVLVQHIYTRCDVAKATTKSKSSYELVKLFDWSPQHNLSLLLIGHIIWFFSLAFLLLLSHFLSPTFKFFEWGLGYINK